MRISFFSNAKKMKKIYLLKVEIRWNRFFKQSDVMNGMFRTHVVVIVHILFTVIRLFYNNVNNEWAVLSHPDFCNR